MCTQFVLRKIQKVIFLIMLIGFSNVSAQGWLTQNSGTTNALNSVFFIDKNIGFVVGNNGTILKTQDGGTTWDSVRSGISADLYAVQFLTESNGWIAGWNDVVLKTTDGGESWQIQNNGILASSSLYDIQFIDDSTGWAVGHQSTINSAGACIYKTANGGLSWSNQAYPGYEAFFLSCSFLNENQGWISGALLGVLITTNGGNSWSIQRNQMSRGIQFVDKDYGWASADGYLIDYTTNGGNNWNASVVGPINPLIDLYFRSRSTGWAVGYPSDSVGKSTDGGISWYRQSTGISGLSLNSIFFVNDSIGWTVGTNGTILKTTTGGDIVTEIQESSFTPSSFILYQNYPNPFNPSTIISFKIPKECYVYIKVFDCLGNELQTLVSETKKEGSYTIKFDASNLGNGIYFYQMVTDNFISTKKMIVLK